MTACVSCSSELDPLWKFCVACGTPVAILDPRRAAIPGAIRPEVTRSTSRSPSRPVLVGTLLGAGAVLGVAALLAAAPWGR